MNMENIAICIFSNTLLNYPDALPMFLLSSANMRNSNMTYRKTALLCGILRIYSYILV